MNRIQKYLLEGLVGAFLLLFLSWEIGYWCNALLGTKFDLQSCWNGFTTLGGAAFLAALKYIADSWVNSDKGKQPYEGGQNQ